MTSRTCSRASPSRTADGRLVEYYVLRSSSSRSSSTSSTGSTIRANSIATIVGTRVLSPLRRGGVGGHVQLPAALRGRHGGGQGDRDGLRSTSPSWTQNVILGGLIGAIVWNLVTWWFGIPSSSSHALIGGYAGAAVSKGGLAALTSAREVDRDAGLHRALAAGRHRWWASCSWSIVFNVFQNVALRHDATASSAACRSSARRPSRSAHGANDAQKTMGIIVSGCSWPRSRCFAGADGVPRVLLRGEQRRDAPSGWSCRRYTHDLARHAVRRVAHRAHDGLAHHQAAPGGRLLRRDGRGASVILLASRLGIPVEHHAHDHGRDRRRRRDAPARGRAVGAGRPDRVGVGGHHSCGGADGRRSATGSSRRWCR